MSDAKRANLGKRNHIERRGGLVPKLYNYPLASNCEIRDSLKFGPSITRHECSRWMRVFMRFAHIVPERWSELSTKLIDLFHGW